MPVFMHTFSEHNRHYVFDANTNSILPISPQQWPVMCAIEKGEINDEAKALLERYREKGYFLDVDIQEIKHPDTDMMPYYLTRKLQKLTLQVTQNCNLRCSYCVYGGMYETRPHAKKTMSFETAKRAIDYVLANSIDTKSLNFGFYGGEPLLEMELIEKCIAYINEKGRNREITFTITTNGTLLTTDIYEKLVSYNFDITISLDGPQPVHDSARVYADGHGSFDDIVRNVHAIKEKFPEAQKKLRFLAVVNPEINESCVEQLYTMDEIFPEYGVNMNFVSTTYASETITYSEELLDTHTQEQAKLFLYMLGKIDRSKVSLIILGNIPSYHNDHELLRHKNIIRTSMHPGGPCLAGVDRLFVTVDGTFYPCERVSETSDTMNIGNVYEGISLEKANAINNIGTTTAEECKKCWAIFHCKMCAAFSDDLNGFSREMRLNQCSASRNTVESTLKTICFLKVHGYDFEKEIKT